MVCLTHRELVGLIAYRFLLIFMLFSSVFFPVEPENDIRFLEKPIINFYSTLNQFFPIHTETTKSLIIPICYT